MPDQNQPHHPEQAVRDFVSATLCSPFVSDKLLHHRVHGCTTHHRNCRYLPVSTYVPSHGWSLCLPTTHDQTHDLTTSRNLHHPPECICIYYHTQSAIDAPFPNAVSRTDQSFLLPMGIHQNIFQAREQYAQVSQED